MTIKFQFPQGPFVDTTTGLVREEWLLWLQNPQINSIVVGETVAVTSGGTGLASYTTGDLLYASASDELAVLNDVATGNALISGGVGAAPAWGKIGLTTHISGTLAAGNGGTGITSLGTGVATALGVNTGTAGAFVLFNGALGTPASGTLTNCTGLPTSGITGGLSVTITTGPLSGGGTTGSMTFTNGVLTAQTPAT